MRILFLCADFSVLSQTFVYDRVTALSARGHIVHVAAIKRSMVGERPFEKVTLLAKAGVISRNLGKVAASSVLRKAMCALGINTRPINNTEIRFRRSFDKLITEFKPDYIHAEFGGMGVFANYAALRHSIPLIVFMHGYDITELPRMRAWREGYQQLWREDVTILAPSEFMKQKVLALGALPGSVVVQENGLDLDRWEFSDPCERWDGKRVSFLFVGRLVEKKAPRQLVRAFAAVRGQAPDIDAELTICGAGPLEGEIKEDVESLCLTDSVNLVGACSSEQIRNHMKRAHIVVQPSVTTASGDMEGLPVVLTEAAASGLPIIATRHSGIPEIVHEGVNGFLVDEHDVEGMAARMIKLGRSPILWSSFGRAGRKLVEAKFKQEVALDKYEALVRERVLDQKSAAH